ncbi:deoxyribodipyrimidine photo-lyase [Buchnera aphidicola (Neophyllaphis varicolor)]|uniref:deoxyribodipyrimidine photo-lyase n=1 Tax=Buchnera aphidicola TaxID=9 RepID=UPI0031B83615
MTIHLMWFRNDLRLNDNKALYEACRNQNAIIKAIYIATPQKWKKKFLSPKKAYFIYRNLIELKKELIKKGIFLYYLCLDSNIKINSILVDFCKKESITHLFYNYQYEYDELKQDNSIKETLNNINIQVTGFHGCTILNPGCIKNKNNKMYTIFTHFKNKVLNILNKQKLVCFPSPKHRKNNIQENIFNDIKYFNYGIEYFDETIFPPGEKKAIKILKNFSKKKIINYGIYRNFPYINHTSKLSAYLSSGIISVKQCLFYLKKYNKNIFSNKNVLLWINEIIWREFFKHLLVAFPYLSQNKTLNTWEKKISWSHNKNYLNLWKTGNTGYPIIDAGMRQLKTLGWMHNRIRMISASFLVKNLFIDWREGQKHFMLNLIDGEFSSNNGNWQWIASVGTDNVPYIRTFNPFIQSKKFDSTGQFIKKYIPELKNIKTKYLHDINFLIKSKIPNYPKPIVEYKKTINKNKEILAKIKYKTKNYE